MKQPFILTLVSSVACAVTAANKAPENTTPTKSKTPNVVFIYADDLGYGDLECYGAKKRTDTQRQPTGKIGNPFHQCSCNSRHQHPFPLLHANRRIRMAQRRNGCSGRKCRNDYPSRTIHHGRYVQKCRLTPLPQ